MGRYQPCEVSVDTALAEAASTAGVLMAMASARLPVGQPETRRTWVSSAGTWCYHTVVGVAVEPGLLAQAADLFYRAASLSTQPWYPQFIAGEVAPLSVQGVTCQLTLARFDVGLRQPRGYRQLVSLHRDDAAMQAITLRSVASTDLPWPAGVKPAYALAPSGDVFEYRDGLLLWHHICTTPGASILPMPLDRWLINAVRGLRLDQAERNTYRQEALMWAAWAAKGFPGDVG